MRLPKKDPWHRRLLVMTATTLMGLLVVLGHLWYLQVFEGARFRELSEKNRIRVRPIAAPRGILFDRNGLPLVDNRPAFTLSLIPAELPDAEAVLARLAALLRIPYAELVEAVDRVPHDSFRPIRVRRGLTLEEVAKVEEWKLALPGVVVEVEPQRAYPGSRLAAHLLGYVREVSEDQLKQGPYRPGDMVGQSGLERLLDDYLRGTDGSERIEVDALGRPVQSVGLREPQPGANVVTTIDRRIQEIAERAIGNRPGAVVVMDPRNGDILAMTSSPAFDLDQFTGPLGRATWLRLVRDSRFPLLNRAFQGQYAPGSIFKIVVATAALQEGVITPFERLGCPQAIRLGRRTFRNWEDRGDIDVYEAIVRSCNTFFYQLGLKVGIDVIARYARAFGLGAPTGIALPGEKPGLVPSRKWKRKRFGEPWRPGETANVSIGQGHVLVTPLQIARLMAAVANGGVLWRPRLVQHVERADGTLVYAEANEVTGRVELSPAVWEFLRLSLWGVVNAGGTGRAARLPGLDVAGKTGTAQIRARRKGAGGTDHAWFAGVAPARDPEVVVVVLIERGGKGGRVAAPVAREIFQRIFFERVAGLARAGMGSS
ncbi:MAG: penicillin-binding protein 2 [Candidatus Methylomirabilia bacterium]